MNRGRTSKFRSFYRRFMVTGDYCPLCDDVFVENPDSRFYPAWDHCYHCGGFRGFVCVQCNSKIPAFWKRPMPTWWKQRVREYLATHDCSRPFLPSGPTYAKQFRMVKLQTEAEAGNGGDRPAREAGLPVTAVASPSQTQGKKRVPQPGDRQNPKSDSFSSNGERQELRSNS